MTLGPHTTIHQILASHPELESQLVRLWPEAVPHDLGARGGKWARVTTLSRLAQSVGLSWQEAARHIQAVAAAAGGATPVMEGQPPDPVEWSWRAEGLRGLLRRLEEEGSLEDAAREAARYLDGMDRRMERQVAASLGGVAAGRSAAVVDAQVQLLSASSTGVDPSSGHPLATLRRENQALVTTARGLAAALEGLDAGAAKRQWSAARPAVERLLDLLATGERHYRRCEVLVCGALERHGRGGLRQLLQGQHREVGDLLARVRSAAARHDVTAAVGGGLRLVAMVEEVAAQEDQLLLPLAETTLSLQDWEEMRAAEDDFGWSLVDPPPAWSG